MLTTTITSTLPDFRTAEQKAEDKIRGINVRAARDLLRVARAVTHEKSGRLKGGLAIQGPFNIATGTLEARISAPSVPYAEAEAARGGEHDFATRMLEEGAGIIDQAAEDIEQAIIAIMEGRA